MRVIIEFDPTAGVVKVMSPASTEGESLIQPAARPTVQGVAQDAGAYAGIAPGEGGGVARTVFQPTVEGAAQDAGAYAGIARSKGLPLLGRNPPT